MKHDKNRIQTGLRLSPEEYKLVKNACQYEGRSIANFTHYIFMRGLKDYLAERGSISPLVHEPRTEEQETKGSEG